MLLVLFVACYFGDGYVTTDRVLHEMVLMVCVNETGTMVVVYGCRCLCYTLAQRKSQIQLGIL